MISMARNTNRTDYVSDKRLFLDAAGNVVDETSDARVSLLVGEGNSIPMEDAIRYGLVNAEGQPQELPQAPAEAESDAGEGSNGGNVGAERAVDELLTNDADGKAVDAPAEDKAIRQSAQNKAKSGSESK